MIKWTRLALLGAALIACAPASAQKLNALPSAAALSPTDSVIGQQPSQCNGTSCNAVQISISQLQAYVAATLQPLIAPGNASAVRSTLGVTASGADTGYLWRANNLSDLASPSTARTQLGLGTLATQSGTFSGSSSGTNTGDQFNVSGNAGTSTKWATGRTITMAGDIGCSTPAIDGSVSVTATCTLPNVSSTAGTFGGPLMIPTMTTNAKGQITASGQVPLGVVPVAQGGTGDTGSPWVQYTATISCYSGTLTSGTAVVRYHTLGKTIDYAIAVNITTNGSCAGQISMNLPVTSFNGPVVFTGIGQELAKTGGALISRVYPNQQSVSIVTSTNGYAAGDGYSLHVNGRYESN